MLKFNDESSGGEREGRLQQENGGWWKGYFKKWSDVRINTAKKKGKWPLWYNDGNFAVSNAVSCLFFLEIR